uniref:Uncharacterized protein n=1 Tax=Setaria viridis TaxID=4556 RepID=A0A4U6V565_SETVI|nr:hypothetical protein SEVIR_4G201800v2 [Setaria viridis]
MSALHPINQETMVSALGALGHFFPTWFPFPPDPVLPSPSSIQIHPQSSLPKHLQVAARMDQHELGKLHLRSR